MTYLVIEGLDCAGKTTQWNLLRQKSNAPLLDLPLIESIKSNTPPPPIVFVKEPSETPLGRLTRELTSRGALGARARFLLFLAQRAELMECLGGLDCKVVSDRSLLSGVAYATEFSIEAALELNLLSTGGALPAKVAFLQLNPHELRKRMAAKRLESGLDEIESLGFEYLDEVQDRFSALVSLLAKEWNLQIEFFDAAMSRAALHENISRFFGI